MLKKLSYFNWPLIVLGFIAFGIALGTWTINVAFSNPVQLDDMYMQPYNQVDLDYEHISASKKRFNAKYKVKIERKNLSLNKEETVTISVFDKQTGAIVSDADVDVVVTRPHTKVSDIWFKALKAHDGKYTVGPFTLTELGRWQIYARVSKGDDTGFKKLEYHIK